MMKKKMKKIIFYIGIVILAMIIMVPVFIIIFTAFKGKTEFYGRSIFSIPEEWRWSNFITAWTKGKLSLYMKNGLIVCLIKVPLGILLASFTAFGLTRMNLKRPTRWFIFFLVGMMIPHQLLLIPLNTMMKNAGLLNTYTGLIFTYLGCGLSFGVLVMRGFFRAIPSEIDESARVDGCGYFRLFWNIILPMAKPAVSTLAILNFLSTWNEYLLSSVLITNANMRTVPTGIFSFIDEALTDYGLLSAAVLMSIIPIFIVYLIFQRYFVEGISGSVKG